MIEDTELREKINKEWGSLRDGHSINIWKVFLKNLKDWKESAPQKNSSLNKK